MISKLVIANRGEVATRIVRTASNLGLGTVVVHTEADARAQHVEEADERVLVPRAVDIDSPLKVQQIVSAAKSVGADAVHPGYGLLAGSAALARACAENGLSYIGPPIELLEKTSSKIAARRLAAQSGLEPVPGSDALCDIDTARREAERIGYPVFLKASAGGGGVGLTLCESENALRDAFGRLSIQAERLFADRRLYLEKAFSRPRHVEVQIAADRFGNVVHLGDRDCSVQRRWLKLIEEAPAAGVDEEVRRELAANAVRFAERIEYQSLGTIQALVSDGKAYFLELNTRLQVEHGVTEAVAGVDLVEWQIRIAMGEVLPATQDEIALEGHAIECRICAEDPERGFVAEPGFIRAFFIPVGPGLRNDVGVREGEFVAPYYDNLLAKLVAHGRDRRSALELLRIALDDYRIDGISTNLGVLRRITADDAFARAEELSTQYMAELLGS